MANITKYMFTCSLDDIENILLSNPPTPTTMRFCLVLGQPQVALEKSLGFRHVSTPIKNCSQGSNFHPYLQIMTAIWWKLPDVLWPIVGDFIFMKVSPHPPTDSIQLKIKPAVAYAIIYPGDEQGEAFVHPCVVQ
jgi:hypothetical protein